MITITGLSKDFTQRTLFKDVNLSIYPNERIGLTGPNGAGKTTLFSIILGEMEPSSGTVLRQKNLNIGYLPQEVRFRSQKTVIQEVTSGDQRIRGLLEEKRKLEDAGKAGSMRYGDILQELEHQGIYQLENEAEKILSGLGFKEEDVRRPVAHLSGGWQMRTLLAKLLLYQYDLLLLDEPTNYLDLSATLWLKDFLARYRGTFIVISHDKVFLNDVTNYTIVLENGQMAKIKGNYQAYEDQKGIQHRTLEKRQKVVEKKREQLERFTQRFHAQPNRAAAVRNKRKMIERLEKIELPSVKKSITEFTFPPTQPSGYTVVTVDHLSKAYGEKQIYRDLQLEIFRGQKICLVGPNGAGKSTLLKLLADVIPPDSGVIKLGHQVERGYFSQTRLDVLNPDRNVLDELASAVQGTYPALEMRNLLGMFNFHGDDVFKLVKVLSGGEKSRLILAKLLVSPPNFILLDEPTTHLDIDGVEALTKAFGQYQGTLCFISHDLFFVQQIADHIIEVSAGRLKSYPGGLDYYLDKKNQGQTLHQRSQTDQREVKRKDKEERKRKRKEEDLKTRELHLQHKQALKRLREIKDAVKALEDQKKDLETESYVKARFMSNAFGKDPQLLKEYGKRLKEIPRKLREIESAIKVLKKERDRISK